ncbi:diguanylate cyclase (GGDEF) domain-containing protein [Hathewaya proteolytica DSM 3090]|uniref:Diguanylate cyclase (GGDEF) domain-containing protein n=1 Tax=Hathewaya proteolytica DSM 3090 TaxID=1121331 RepID=A0A1M6QK00_9CLOT|nr:sensor domain-containing phosphodiesterase [Hathewaya proteolytica]SHK20450.1 diguanylate cyclase (GGDEF) domain-containing protein [Hathewaya proteolytica DSM 3090]
MTKNDIIDALGEIGIIDCIKSLLVEEDLHKAMTTVLEYVLHYYKADRAYVFEFDWEKNLSHNTYEKCIDKVTPQKDNLQSIPTFIMNRWIEEFNKNNCVIIKNMEDMKIDYPEEYESLSCQDIHSLMAVPFRINQEIVGFLGVDNPDDLSKGSEFLCSLSYFIINEISKRRMNDKLKYLSYHDSLTNLNNRNKYMDYTSKINPEALSSLGVIFADINGLKQINDTYGHSYGDAVIISISQAIKNTFKDHYVFRLSGDEFVVFCENISRQNFLKSIDSFKASLLSKSNNGVSIGYTWCDSEINLRKMVYDADELMYINKQEFYKKNLTNKKTHVPLLLKDLLDSLNHKKFTVFLQPKFDLSTDKVYGAEALVRRINSEMSIVPPDKFIPLLEKEKTIQYLDFFVFEECCRLLNNWISRGKTPMKISLNFSRITLMEESFIHHVMEICKKYKVSPRMIEIEITESVGEIERNYIASIGAELKKLGFILSLDDFGCMYSSLDMITLLDFDVIKIDKSLVLNIEKNKKSEIIIKNIINICHDMNIKCLVEGIENLQQLNFMKELNCDYIQGYVISKPISIDCFETAYMI